MKPEADAAKLFSKSIHELGKKWHLREDGKKLVEDSCLSINPGWYDDLVALQKLLIAVVCLLAGPIILGYLTIFANYEFVYKNAMRVILDSEQCVMNNPTPIRGLVGEGANCHSVCQGLREISIPDNLSKEDFLSQFAYSGRPVLIRDATRDWTAFDHFSFQFFKDVFQSHAEKLEKWRVGSSTDDIQATITEEAAQELDDCQFFPYKTDFRNLAEFFNISDARSRLDPSERSYYVGWNNCFRQVREILRDLYTRPAFLPVESESSNLDWIFMGGSTAQTGGGAPVHIDHVSRPSWQAVIAGEKTWLLYPPPECKSVCTDEIAVDMKKGDILVVDTNLWYHGTKVPPGVLTIAIGSEYD